MSDAKQYELVQTDIAETINGLNIRENMFIDGATGAIAALPIGGVIIGTVDWLTHTEATPLKIAELAPLGLAAVGAFIGAAIGRHLFKKRRQIASRQAEARSIDTRDFIIEYRPGAD